MAIAMALPGFNYRGRSVTPIFLSRSRLYVQLSPHCPKMNKKSMWDIKSCHLAPARQVKLRSLNANLFFKVYMTDFFLFARLNLPNVLISIAKKNFDSDFPSPCFDVPKASNFTSSGVQNHETKNRRQGMIVTSFQDFKLRKKQISPTFSYFLINSALLHHFLAN